MFGICDNKGKMHASFRKDGQMCRDTDSGSQFFLCYGCINEVLRAHHELEIVPEVPQIKVQCNACTRYAGKIVTHTINVENNLDVAVMDDGIYVNGWAICGPNTPS